MPLSRSDVLAWRQCPKRLWLELHRPELRDWGGVDRTGRPWRAALENASLGREVFEVARRLYDPDGRGAVIDGAGAGVEEAVRRSAEALASGEGPVFGAGVTADGVVVFIDAMLPTGAPGSRGWRMIEVKATAGVKAWHHDDLAIRAWVARKAGWPIGSVAVAHLDTPFVYEGDGNYQGLFREVDLTGETESREVEVEEWVAGARSVAERSEAPDVVPGPQCLDPFACPFTAHCARGHPGPDYPLSSLPDFSGHRKETVEAFGIQDLREVPDEFLTPLQRRVRDVTITGEPWFDREGAAAVLASYGFPAWFLDFETVMQPVPVWKGTSPFEPIPFQFSLHRVEADGTVSHEAFLDLSGADPSRPLAEALVERTGTTGPVFVYNAKFERRIVQQLAGQFPDLAAALKALADRIVDLLPVARDHFYDPSQHGTWSLKVVLPAVCPELSYDSLNGVADGAMALDAYREAVAPGTAPERKAELERQLLAYCELDTLAMVRLWERFRG
jgi:hypothetical protein